MISVDEAQKMVLHQVTDTVLLVTNKYHKVPKGPKSGSRSGTKKYQRSQNMVLFQVPLNVTLLFFLLMVYFQCSTMMVEEMGVRVLATELVDFRSALGRVLCQQVKHKLGGKFAETRV